MNAGVIVAALAWILAGEAVLPAVATELPLSPVQPPLHRTAAVAVAVKKPTPRPHLISIASEVPVTTVSGSRASYLLILGVAF
jgi:hypothetical protein